MQIKHQKVQSPYVNIHQNSQKKNKLANYLCMFPIVIVPPMVELET